MRSVIDKYLFNKNDAILVVADFGKFPLMETTDRYYNVQMSESLMVNVAIGLALSGKDVYVYSASNFMLYRAFDTIKHNIVELNNIYKHIRITFLNAGSGFIYNFGITHMLYDDIQLVQNHMPNVRMYFPYDEDTTIKCMFDKYRLKYIRLCPDNCKPVSISKCISPKLHIYTFGWLVNEINDIIIGNNINAQLHPILQFFNANIQHKNAIIIYDSLKIDKYKTIPTLCFPEKSQYYNEAKDPNRQLKRYFSKKQLQKFILEHL